MTVAVWIDTDSAVGVPGADIDDGYALLQALGSRTVEVIGVSTVYGNADLEVVHPIAEELLEVAGAYETPLHWGASEPGDLGHPTSASAALAAALDEQPLTVVALGPLTNVATALCGHPGLAHRVERLVMVAGRRPGHAPQQPGADRLADPNFERDPAAVSALLELPLPSVTLAGVEAAASVTVRRGHVERLAAGPPAARWLAERSADWLASSRERFAVDGFHPCDTLAVGLVAAPGSVATEPVTAAVVDTASGPELRAAAGLPDGRGADRATVAAAGFVEELLAAILAVAPPETPI